MKPWSLRAKLMLLIGLAILPLALLEYYTVQASRARVEARVGREALRLSRLVAGHQRAMLESARQLLMTLTEVDCLRAKQQDEGCQNFLKKLQKASPVYANIGAIDRSGSIYASAQPVPGAGSFSGDPFFTQIRESRQWRVLDQRAAERLSPVPSLALAYPIISDDGEFLGVVFVAISLAWTEQEEMNDSLPPHTVVATVDSEARVISHFPDPEEWVGRDVENPGIIEAILNAGGKGGWVTTKVYGKDRIYGVEPLRIGGGNPVFVCVGVNREVAIAPYHRALRQQIGWASGIAGGALLGAWLLGSLFMVRPARHLVGVARAVAAGDSANRSTLERSAGEFYEIGTAINRMADAAVDRIDELSAVHEELRRAHNELEARVERRTAELYQARELMVDAIETLEAGFVMFDAEGRMIACNEPFRRIFANCRESILPGATFQEILSAFFSKGGKIEGVTDPNEWISMRMEYFYEAKGAGVQARINGRWILASDHRMRDGGIVSLRTDVSERVEAHQALEKVADELRRSNEELEQFAYVVSHDLQEPLRMVASYTKLLERRYGEKLEPDAQEFIRYAADGARRMQQFIDDLLRYSRVAKRQRPFARVPMQEVVAGALENVSYSWQEKHAEVNVSQLPVVIGDRLQLTQLLQNLLSNAVKFSGPDPLKVLIRAEREGAMWRFAVQDNGLGLDPEDAERVFIIFQRLHAGELEVGGTGIGLAICKKIVERHGGKIWVESRPGEGATFYFTLPAISETSISPPGADLVEEDCQTS